MTSYAGSTASRRRDHPQAYQPFPSSSHWSNPAMGSDALLRARVPSHTSQHSHDSRRRPATGTAASAGAWDSASESGLSVLSALPHARDAFEDRAARKARKAARRQQRARRDAQAQALQEAPPAADATDSPLRRWARWVVVDQPGLARYSVVLCVVLVVLVKWCAGLGGYSAYHSLLLGVLARLHPASAQYVTLRPDSATASSREVAAWEAQMAWLERDGGMKNWMRATVVGGDLLVWVSAVVVYCRRNFRASSSLSSSSSTKADKSQRRMLVAMMTILLQPALILIDSGHFQYNSIMLGLTLWAVNAFQAGHDVLGSVAFVLSLGFKQMSLYYAPAVFAYLLGKCFWLGGREGTSLFINLALTVTATFLVLFAPFLSSLSTFLQALHRIFPFARGLFEDKVANVWCALNVVVKLRDLVPVSTLAKLALVATATALVPSVGAVLYVSYRLGRERALSPSPSPRAAAPTVILLPHALFLSAMAFFLLSFQVHEKSILLPLMPLTLLMGAREVGYGRMDWEWGVLVNNVAVFSMWPLLQRDGVATQYAALTLLWNYALGYNPLTLRPSFVKYLSLGTYLVVAVLHALEALAPPPAHLPDLFPVLNLCACAGVFGLAWLWAGKRLVQEAWALGGVPLGSGTGPGRQPVRRASRPGLGARGKLPLLHQVARSVRTAPSVSLPTMFARTAARNAFRQARQTMVRQSRGMAHNHHTGVGPAKSDLPWIVGSGLVFVPLFFSLTSPPEALKHATSPAHPDKHQDVPASTKATDAEDPADKEPSPSHAAAAEANAAEEASHEDAAEAQPAQEDKDEDNTDKGKEVDTQEAKITPADAQSAEEGQEATPQAKAAAKEKQPAKQVRLPLPSLSLSLSLSFSCSCPGLSALAARARPPRGTTHADTRSPPPRPQEKMASAVAESKEEESKKDSDE
ncbi:glucosyltransferase [Rhodotorula diobovata]|uniref:dolichyl-P-Glc:Man9GlcNAc2-PP-dolichol alpha-1,3-glucosyltransferase n=1 Tax=Rhodotorula diobovata TaxID=5288 RepID=A0A5C5FWF1_9BASI|nr:glucosyltransferase [Rhodotorula diobovata]